MSSVMVAQIKPMGYLPQQLRPEFTGIDCISCIYLMISDPTLETLKQVDPDRCRAAMFADKETRERLLLLYAFHYELAKVPELVSEPMIGAIRYQWWRDAIAEIYDGKPVRQHEIAVPLAVLIADCEIPRFWLDKLIDARERDLDPQPFSGLDEAKAYCRDTSGLLMQLAVKVTGQEPDDKVMAAGQAWGLTGLVRGWEFYKDSVLKEIVLPDLLNESRKSYFEAKTSLGKLPPALAPAILYTALVPGFLKRREADPPKAYSQLAKQMHLLRASVTGNFPA